MIESTVYATPPWKGRATAWCHVREDTIICRGYPGRHAEPDPATIVAPYYPPTHTPSTGAT